MRQDIYKSWQESPSPVSPAAQPKPAHPGSQRNIIFGIQEKAMCKFCTLLFRALYTHNLVLFKRDVKRRQKMAKMRISCL